MPKAEDVVHKILKKFDSGEAMNLREPLEHFLPEYGAHAKRIYDERDIAKALKGNPLPRVVVMGFKLEGNPNRRDCFDEWRDLAKDRTVITSGNLGKRIEASKVANN